MANNFQFKRGTRSGLNTLASSNGIKVGEPYLITDEARFALGLTASTFSSFVKQGETFTTTVAGLVPASGTSNTTDFLRRDGTWATPPGGGGGGTTTNPLTFNNGLSTRSFDGSQAMTITFDDVGAIGYTGGTIYGRLTLDRNVASVAPFNIVPASVPTSPLDGDMWTTTAGLFVRINGATVGPLGAGGSFSGGTLTSKLTTIASSAGSAPLNIPHGTVAGSLTNGDIWTTTAGLFVRINGATVGPLLDGSGGGAADPLVLASETTADSPAGGAPVTGVKLFTAVRANRRQPAWIAPTGRTERMQAFLGANDTRSVDIAGPGIAPSLTANVGYQLMGCTMAADVAAAAGQLAHPVMSTTNWLTMQTRRTFSTTTTATTICEAKAQGPWCSRRSVGGGFHFAIRFGFETAIQSGGRVFVGLFGSAAALAATTDFNAQTNAANSIAIVKNAADSTLRLGLQAATGTVQYISLPNAGGALTAGLTFHLEIFCAKGDAGFGYRFFRYNADGTSVVDEGYVTSGAMPGIDTLFTPHMFHQSTGVVQTMALIQMYCEAD